MAMLVALNRRTLCIVTMRNSIITPADRRLAVIQLAPFNKTGQDNAG
jgi:hypothetical protein